MLCCVACASQQSPITPPLSRHGSPWGTHGIWTRDSQQDKKDPTRGSVKEEAFWAGRQLKGSKSHGFSSLLQHSQIFHW